MKCFLIISRLVSVILLCLWTVNVKAGCPKQLGKDSYKQLQKPLKGQEPQTCASLKTCCTRQLETTLEQKGLADLNAKVSKRLHGVKGSTVAIRQDIQGYFEEVVRNAKEKSLYDLRQSHANLSRIGGPLVTKVFDQLEKSIANNKINFTSVVLQFLKDSFPPIFNYATGESRPFSSQYEDCLKGTMKWKQIYGGGPHRIASDVDAIVKPMQLFLQGLTFAERVVNGAKQLDFTKGCSKILLQMTHCAMCSGEDSSVKPCESYCIDVLRNCLVTDDRVHKQWNLFFDAMDNLALGLSTHNVQEKLFQVYNHLSAVVAQVIPQLHNPTLKLQEKMHNVCGRPSYRTGTSTTSTTGQTSHTVHAEMKQKMTDVKTKLTHVRTVFEEMPRDVCVYDRVSALRTEKVIVASCWNGTAIGRYMGPVSSPLPSRDVRPIDQSRIETMIQQTNTMTNDIKKHTPDYYPTEIDENGSGGSGESGSGCMDDEDCGSGGSGGGKNEILSTDEPPTRRNSDNDISFDATDSPQDGGVNADPLSSVDTVIPKLSLLVTMLVLALRI